MPFWVVLQTAQTCWLAMLASDTSPMPSTLTTAVQSSQLLATAMARSAEEKMKAFMVEDWELDWDWMRICSLLLSLA